MGRLLRASIRIDGELVATTPVHSGGPAESVFSDLPLAVDGDGTVYFPGTSIAGPLRAWWRRTAGPTDPSLVDSVWGRVESEPGSNKGWASILLVHDAPLIKEIDLDLDLAQHVSISRETGAAAGTLKFDRELAPAKARFRLMLELQRPAKSYGPKEKLGDARWCKVQQHLRGMLEDLAKGAIRFGADKSRGRGALRLEKVWISSRDLTGGILDTLRSNSQSHGMAETPCTGLESDVEAHTESVIDSIADFFGKEIKPIRPPKALIELTLECRPVAPIMQRHEAEGTAVDMLPAVAVEGDRRKPLLSGTGIKGAFRAQSERILHTVLDLQDMAKDPLDLIVALYGDRARRTDVPHPAHDHDDPRYPQPGRGAVSFDDCRLDRGLSLDEWHTLLTYRPGKKQEALAEFNRKTQCTAWKGFAPAALVAIDRWTGGAADKFLFSRLEPDMERITLSATIHVERIAPPPGFWKQFDPHPSNQSQNAAGKCNTCAERAEHIALASFRQAALALFLLTLRDFARGRIPLGYGVNRGLGDLDLCKATLKGWFDLPVAHGLDRASGGDTGPDRGGDVAEWPEFGDEAPHEDHCSTSDIALGKGDFSDGEKMKPFQPLQVAWGEYLECKRNGEGADDG